MTANVQEAARNQIAVREGIRRSVVDFIEDMKPELARAMPGNMDPERIARLALTCVRKEPKLAECSPESFAGSLLTAAALGLEPGVGGEAYLAPFNRECTLIVGYQGMAKLFFNHPLAKHLDAQAVHENDEFDYAYGLQPYLTHKPAKGARGKVTHYYAAATLTTEASAFVVLTAEEVKALRQGKVGPDPRFKGGDPMRWMERKTTLRQLIKLLPKSPRLIRAAQVDERPGSELHAELVAERQAPQLDSGSGTASEVAVGEFVDDEPGTFSGPWPAGDGAA